MTFSLVGLAVAVLVLAPNLLLLVAPPRDGIRTRDAGVVATVLERAGQVGCLVAPVVTGAVATLSPWLFLVVVAIAGYLALWVRYLVERRFAALYRSVGPLPVPMAVLPVVAFLATGAWLASWWVVAAAVVLGAGHIPNSLATRRRIRADAPGRGV